MILEQAVFTVAEGSEQVFEAAMGEAKEVISQAAGFQSFRLQRGIDNPSAFLLLVEWDAIEDHMVGFRKSENFKRWRELIGPFFAADPRVEHFEAPSVVRATQALVTPLSPSAPSGWRWLLG